MHTEENLGTIKTYENGIEKEYEILFSFDCEQLRKTYIGYTDHSMDNAGKMNIYLGSYDPLLYMGKLDAIETPEEKAMVANFLAGLQNDLNGAGE